MSSTALFHDESALKTLNAMEPDERDAVDFGVVEVSDEGIVRTYNLWEKNLSGLASDSVIGRNFFVDIAPCTNNFMFAQKFLDGGQSMDEEFDYVFTFKMKPTKVVIRFLKSQEASFILVRHRS